MKIVVTGATGNLGTSTVEALANDDRVSEVIGIARRKPDMYLPKCTFVRADVTRDDLAGHFRGADAVVHLAWAIQPLRDAGHLDAINLRGTQRVLAAVRDASVPHLVVASSVGAYSPGPKDGAVDESWPTGGISSSLYSSQKAKVERFLDAFESEASTRVVRMRPALVFKPEAAAEIGRLFVGPWVPRFLLRPGRIPFVPKTEHLRFQCIHSKDVGRAFALAALSEVSGAFNVAAEPVLDPMILSQLLKAPRLPVSERFLRSAVDAAFHLRLCPIDHGWVDLALETPLMNTTRAREVLGFEPRVSAKRAVLELFEGLHRGEGSGSEPLQSKRRILSEHTNAL